MFARVLSTRGALCSFLGAAFMLSPVGCSKDEKKPEPAAKPSAEVMAQLAKADAFDGKTDKVVSKCAMCALRMDGKPKHEFEIEGYKMHFCGGGCLDRCKKDSSKVLLALKIPEK